MGKEDTGHAKAVPGTRKYHHITQTHNNKIILKRYSFAEDFQVFPKHKRCKES